MTVNEHDRDVDLAHAAPTSDLASRTARAHEHVREVATVVSAGVDVVLGLDPRVDEGACAVRVEHRSVGTRRQVDQDGAVADADQATRDGRRSLTTAPTPHTA